jgi:hypothetical protein
MRTPRVLLASLIAVAALSPTAAIAATPTLSPVSTVPTTAPVTTSQGIIMRDGGVCDPIRHMGC